MKKIIDLSIGGMKFPLEDEAYSLLKKYLEAFEQTIDIVAERKEVMEDVENRVAEILHKEQKFEGQVVTKSDVRVVITHLGEINFEGDGGSNADGSSSDAGHFDDNTQNRAKSRGGYTLRDKKIYRNVDDKRVGGVASGIAAYFNIDPTILRVIFILLALFGGSGILIYIVLWTVIPKADTIVQKLEMMGYAPTAENINRFKAENKIG